MKSSSNLTIRWCRPDLSEERWEFSQHPDKQDFYSTHRIDWERLTSSFATGHLVPYPRSDSLNGIPVALSYSSYDDYCRYLAKAKRGYRRNYSRMEDDLQRHGTLTLPAPIIVQCRNQALLFSGYRRLCLAWNYGMTPYVWLTRINGGEPTCS